MAIMERQGITGKVRGKTESTLPWVSERAGNTLMTIRVLRRKENIKSLVIQAKKNLKACSNLHFLV